MTAQELAEWADCNVGDIPLNNAVPLFQALGKQGITIRQLMPFLSDAGAQARLALHLRSIGHGFTTQEKAAAEILGWDNCLFAPEVCNFLGKIPSTTSREMGINLSPEILKKCAAENQSLASDDSTEVQHGFNCWRLIYSPGLSLSDLKRSKWGPHYHLLIERSGNIELSEISKVPADLSKIPAAEPGYHLVNFHPLSIDPTKLQSGPGTRIMGATHYAEALLLHLALRDKLPFPPADPSHLAIDDTELVVSVEVNSHPGDNFRHLKFRMAHGKKHVDSYRAFMPAVKSAIYR